MQDAGILKITSNYAYLVIMFELQLPKQVEVRLATIPFNPILDFRYSWHVSQNGRLLPLVSR